MPFYFWTIVLILVDLLLSVVVLFTDKKGHVLLLLLLAVIGTIVSIMQMEIPKPEIYTTKGQSANSNEIYINAEWPLVVLYTTELYHEPDTPYVENIPIDSSVSVSAKAFFLGFSSELVIRDIVVTDDGIIPVEVETPGSSISYIVAKITKENLYSGEHIEKKDIAVEGITIAGDKIEIDDYSYSPQIIKEGENVVTVSYHNLEPYNITTTGLPARLVDVDIEYIGGEIHVGDRLDKKSFIVNGTYSDGSIKRENEFRIEPTYFEEEGSHDITVIAGDILRVIRLCVNPQETNSIEDINSDNIVRILSESVITDSGTFGTILGDESINVFSQEVHNAFTINTAFTIWGDSVHKVDFRIDGLPFDVLTFTICGETGTSGSMVVDVFLDRPISDDNADYTYTFEEASYPQNAEVNISGKSTMAIRVNNNTLHQNRMVFYNFNGY